MLKPGVIVKGRFGPRVAFTATSDQYARGNIATCSEGDNEDIGSKQQRPRSFIEGQIMYSVGPSQWMVRFEDDQDRQCHSLQLIYVFDPTDGAPNEVSIAPNNANERKPLGIEILHNADVNISNDTTDDEEQESDQDLDEQDDVEDDAEEDLEGNLDNVSDGGGGYDAVFEGSYTVYEAKRRLAEAEKAELIRTGYQIVKTDAIQQKCITWKAIEFSLPTEVHSENLEFGKLGVRDMEWDKFQQSKRCIRTTNKRKIDAISSPSISSSNNKLTPFLDLFLLLWPGDWQSQLKQLNHLIQKEIKNKKKNGKSPKKIADVTPNEFFVFLGIMISAAPAGKSGKLLFQEEQDIHKTGHHNLLPLINFGPYMKHSRFNDIRSKFHYAFSDLQRSDPSLPTFDPWYPVVKLVEEFNRNRSAMVAASHIKVQDESMSAWNPGKDKAGGLPNISFTKRKSEPLGTKFQSVACGKTGIMIQLEIQIGQETPLQSKNTREHGAAYSTLHVAHDTVKGGQREDVHQPIIFYGDSLSASIKKADNISEIDHDFVGPVKTSTTLFVRKEFESLMKGWPEGSHLVLEGTSASNNKLIAVGYKYNTKKVLSFVATKNAGSTLSGEPYLARFIGDNNNVCSCQIERPQIISTYFKHSNVIDKHNHARQNELSLEKHWVTLNCWFRIVTTVVGICIVDCWKAYCHKFGDKEFNVCNFAEQVAFELMHNNFEDSMASLQALSPLDRSTQWKQPQKSVTVTNNTSEISPLHYQFSGRNPANNEWLLIEMMQLHPHEKNVKVDKDGYPKRNRCKECQRKTPWLCTHCKVFVCRDNQGKSCNKCYRKHVLSKHPGLELEV